MPPTPFPQTTRALAADPPAAAIRLLTAGGVLLAAWVAWMALARVQTYESTPHARVEALGTAHPAVAAAGGTVARVAGLELGRAVRRGEVLVELDARADSLALGAASARVASLRAERDAARGRVGAAARARDRAAATAAAAVAEAEARASEAAAAARGAEREHERALALETAGHLSRAERERAAVSLAAARARADAAAAAVALAGARGREEAERARAGVADASAEVSVLAAELARARSEEAERRLALESRTVRAPVAGRLARVAPLAAGEVLPPGAAVAHVVAEGPLRVVADFPARVTGRVRPGQPGTLRLEGYPWTRYGSAAVRVVRVATEPADGRVRVEAELASAPPGVPLGHGMTGALEVVVARSSPLDLLTSAAAGAGGRAAP